MTNEFSAWTTVAIVVTALLPAPANAELPIGSQSEMSTAIESRITQNYLLYLPDNYGDADKHPLLLFLHGAGERGDNDLELVKVHGPPKLIAAGRKFPFIVVSPQCPANGWWEAAHLSSLLDRLEAEYKVDPARIYVTGLSMGGFGTWALAQREPERFAAIAPICGGGNTIAARFRDPLTVPTWAFHGALDTVVPLSKSEEMVDVVKGSGTEAKLTVYPNVQHDSWTDTYANDALYRWLLDHRRTP